MLLECPNKFSTGLRENKVSGRNIKASSYFHKLVNNNTNK